MLFCHKVYANQGKSHHPASLSLKEKGRRKSHTDGGMPLLLPHDKIYIKVII
jgi:hypothetical protein